MFDWKIFKRRKRAPHAESQQLKAQIYFDHERFIYYYAMKLAKSEETAYTGFKRLASADAKGE